MHAFRLLIALLALSTPAAAQDREAPDGAIIQSAQVSGIDLDRLSPGLREAIKSLAGQPLSRDRLRELVSRIEGEHPDRIAAIRTVALQEGQAQVVFLVARIDDDRELTQNINARYTIESVEITGVPDTDVTQDLRDAFQQLVGRRYDSTEIAPLVERLRSELPGYEIRRRTVRGSERGQIRLTIDLLKGEELRYLSFAATPSKAMYHSDQGWSFAGDLGIGGRDFRVGVGFALSNQDDLIEEYDGWTLRFESRKVGSERVGLSLGLSWYWPDWQEETLFALAARPHLPRAYEQRTTIEPAMAFALTRNVVVAGGISVTDLESLAPPHASSMASAAIFSVAYDQRWEAGKGAQHRLSGNVGLRAATDALDTDLHYTRYFGEARYRFTHRRQTVLASGMFGHITGDAPMFERFSLGNSTTLRGWDKFDILPAGGDEMAHGSVEYRNRGFAVFFDAGSVWERETEAKMRLSTGFGFHIDNFFMTLGFPLNADELRTMFMIGVRF